MLEMTPLPLYSNSARRGLQLNRKRRTLAWRRRRDSASLWLAMLMLLLVQPLFAEAGERVEPPEQGLGQHDSLENTERVQPGTLWRGAERLHASANTGNLGSF